jgi:hypothetical protein
MSSGNLVNKTEPWERVGQLSDLFLVIRLKLLWNWRIERTGINLRTSRRHYVPNCYKNFEVICQRKRHTLLEFAFPLLVGSTGNSTSASRRHPHTVVVP